MGLNSDPLMWRPAGKFMMAVLTGHPVCYGSVINRKVFEMDCLLMIWIHHLKFLNVQDQVLLSISVLGATITFAPFTEIGW